jgi:acetyl-CoA carboxylase biotin carboxyl carrier protein
MHVPVAAAAAPALAAAPAAAATPAEAESALPHGSYTIDSPMVGTFYAAATPGDPPFVLPGATVGVEQTVCIVEAMKIMNEVTSKEACIIEKVLVENGQPVEFGQPLFQARPIG